MYLIVQSCLHVVINFPRPPKPDQNMLYFSLFHRPLQNSAKFHRNGQIPRLGSKFHIPQKTVGPIQFYTKYAFKLKFTIQPLYFMYGSRMQ